MARVKNRLQDSERLLSLFVRQHKNLANIMMLHCIEYTNL